MALHLAPTETVDNNDEFYDVEEVSSLWHRWSDCPRQQLADERTIQDGGASSFLVLTEYLLRYIKWLELQRFPIHPKSQTYIYFHLPLTRTWHVYFLVIQIQSVSLVSDCLGGEALRPPPNPQLFLNHIHVVVLFTLLIKSICTFPFR